MKIDLTKTNGSSPPSAPRKLTAHQAVVDPNFIEIIHQTAWSEDAQQEIKCQILDKASEFHAATDQVTFVRHVAKSVLNKFKRLSVTDGKACRSGNCDTEAFDDISLSGVDGRGHPDWLKLNANETRLIAKIDRDRQPQSDKTELHAETLFERIVRVIGASKADWFLDYITSKRSNGHRVSQADRAKFYRLRRKLATNLAVA